MHCRVSLSSTARYPKPPANHAVLPVATCGTSRLTAGAALLKSFARCSHKTSSCCQTVVPSEGKNHLLPGYFPFALCSNLKLTVIAFFVTTTLLESQPLATLPLTTAAVGEQCSWSQGVSPQNHQTTCSVPFIGDLCLGFDQGSMKSAFAIAQKQRQR